MKHHLGLSEGLAEISPEIIDIDKFVYEKNSNISGNFNMNKVITINSSRCLIWSTKKINLKGNFLQDKLHGNLVCKVRYQGRS